MKPVIKASIKVICRETSGDTAIAYVLDGTFDASDASMFSLRSRYNPELEYYAVSPRALTEEQTPIILNLLKMCGECSLAVKL